MLVNGVVRDEAVAADLPLDDAVIASAGGAPSAAFVAFAMSGGHSFDFGSILAPVRKASAASNGRERAINAFPFR